MRNALRRLTLLLVAATVVLVPLLGCMEESPYYEPQRYPPNGPGPNGTTAFTSGEASKTGFKPVELVVEQEIDRAAPLGVGDVKVGGNYAAGMRASKKAKAAGFTEVLYLDAREKKYIDESGPANFFGIKNNTYITPLSDSILPSITNKSIMKLAEEMGLKVEHRKVPYEELPDFEEVGACGTAAVISPIKRIYDADYDVEFNYGSEPGEWSTKLYNKLRAIQYGDAPDNYGWVRFVE